MSPRNFHSSERAATLRNETDSSNALAASVYSYWTPQSSAPKGSGELPAYLDFSKDIYGTSDQALSMAEALGKTDPSKILFTTPYQDKNSAIQPDFFLTSEGKLQPNPKATASKDGSVKIEVTGNDSAKQAKQYADKLQKQAISDLITMFKALHPGEKVPEMWQAIVDDQSDAPDQTQPDQPDDQTGVEPSDSDSQGAAPTSSDMSGSGQGTAPAGGDIPANGQGFSNTTAPEGSYSGGNVSRGSSELGGNGAGGAADTFVGVNGKSLVQDSPGTITYDSTPDANAANILMHAGDAQNDLNHEMWKLTDNGASGGVEGCAASVSAVLNQAGDVGHFDAVHIDVLQTQLQAQGWTVTSEPQPGDVWIGRGGASPGHTGIVGPNGTLYNNNSNDGEWHQENLNETAAWNHNVYLKPPPSK